MLSPIVNLTKCDILCLTETWLSPSTLDSILGLQNFRIFRKDIEARGGGCLIAVRTNLKSFELSTQITSEILSVNILCNSKLFTVICCYCPPNLPSVVIKTFYTDLSAVLMLTKNYIILGDFNIPTDSLPIVNTRLYGAKEFLNFMTINQPLELLPIGPTRCNHVLDLILTNNNSMIKALNLLPSLFNSDHMIFKHSLKLVKTKVDS